MAAEKFPGARNAVGYWGRCGPDKLIRYQQTPESIRVLLEDKLIARGKLVTLWLPVHDTTPGVVPCTCVKDTSKAADQPCLSCYGQRFIPGFLKFMTQTLFWSSAEASSFVLTGCQVDLSIKPNRITLSPSSTSATIVTTDKAYTNPQAALWTVHMDAFDRSPGATVTAEFSTDAGVTYNPIANINNIGVQPVGTGTLRLRITMTRTATTVKSPVFEIARVRRVTVENVNPRLTDQKVNYQPGQIIVARTQVLERFSLEANRGIVADHLQDRGWTSPLDLFDQSLTHDTPPCRIDEGFGAGPHPFYEYSDGVLQGTRYPIVQLAWNEQIGVFTQQSWADRRAQPGEVYNLVF